MSRLKRQTEKLLLFTTLNLTTSSLACGYIPQDLYTYAHQAGEVWGIDGNLMVALIWVESRFCVDVESPKGAYGLAQLMPGTARELGVNRYDPQQNIWGGAKYFRKQLDRFQNIEIALAAYNAGPGAVENHGGIPPYKETQKYVTDVINTYWSLVNGHVKYL